MTTEQAIGSIDVLHEAVQPYARELQAAGFTVYVPITVRYPNEYDWFHYSRIVNGRECFGIYYGNTRGFEGPDHSMPIKPSRLNGSGAKVGARWGDEDTRGLDDLDPTTVRYAEIVARPKNWCPYNAEPTREAIEATERAYLGHRGTPHKYYKGAWLENEGRATLSTNYVPAEVA